MRRLFICFVLFALVLASGCNQSATESKPRPHTVSSFDPPQPGDKITAAKEIHFDQADLSQVLNIYAELSGRSVIRGTDLPDVKISFVNQTAMTGPETLQALDTVLAAQGITTILQGDKYVKVVSAKKAHEEQGPILELPADQLPDSSSFCTYIVTLKTASAMDVVPALQPLAKLPNSIIAIAGGTPTPMLPAMVKTVMGNRPIKHGTLILRDYSSNIRAMLKALEKMDAK